MFKVVVIPVLLSLCMFPTLSRAQMEYKGNPDTLIYISKEGFDSLVDLSINKIDTKGLAQIPDDGHIGIMMCLNTIFMAKDTTLRSRFMGGRYEKLLKLSEQKNYTRDITKVYPQWVPNRGMGYYFPQLGMELYGTPRLYAWFQVTY